MGMTREEIVKSMSVQDAIQVLKDTNTYGTADIAKSVAIDTMHKYQKIEQIVDKWNEGIYDDEVLKDDSSSENPNKSEIPTSSDDCISRQDVLSEIIRFSTEEGASVECQQLYCDVNNMPSVTPQESKTMVEIDLYSVIKQKYIEREVLDKIREEIEQLRLHKAQFITSDNKVCIDSQEVLNIIDKYKAESGE